VPLPGITVERGERGPATLEPGDVSTLFAAVITARGPVGTPVECWSWPQVRARMGGHQGYTTLRTVEQYFRQSGGGRVVLSRLVGPDARHATLALNDARGDAVLTLRAVGPGGDYHAVRCAVATTGNDCTITLTDGDTTVLEGTYSSDLAAKAALDATGLVVAEPGAGTWPIDSMAATALSGGDDDRANIRDQHVVDAVSPAVLPADLGPGTLAAPGYTTFAVAQGLIGHAQATNRFVRFAAPDTASAGTIITLASQIRALGRGAGWIQLLAGWPQIDVGGVTVAVSPEGVVAGREALTDRSSGPGPGQPAAHSFGAFDLSIIGVSQTYSPADREALNDAGVSVIVNDRGEIFPEDAITAADPHVWPQYSEVAGMRVAMAIEAQAREAMRPYRSRNMDAHGHLAAEVTKDLVAICADWHRRDALYGADETEAFAVEVETIPDRRRLVGHIAIRNTTSVQRIHLTLEQVATGDTI